MKKKTASMIMLGLFLATGSAWASLSVVAGELAGPTDWLADVRLRNFNSTVSDYEMMVNASPTRKVGELQTNGQVPGPYAWADWAFHNDFTITYDPTANFVSLRLVGSGARQLGTPGGYDVTISRAPDAVTAGPVNYINFQLWDRVTFPTFTDLTLSDLDGTDLGLFSIPASGIGQWSILDPGGAILNDGFVLRGSFDLDYAKLAEGKEGDKLVFAIGNNPNVPVPEPASLSLLGLGLAGLAVRGIRRKIQS